MPAIVSCLVLLILGIVSFRSLPVTRLPNIDIPIVQIAITQSGAAPAELETQVTKKVEDAVAGVQGIWHIISAVSDGASTTTIQFDIGTNVDRALNDVKDAIAKIRTDLPRGIDEPIVQRFDIEGLPIVTYAASSRDRSVEAVSWFVDDTVARELQAIRGRRRRDALGRRRPRDPRRARSAQAPLAGRHGRQRFGAASLDQRRPRGRPRRARTDRNRRSARWPAPARSRISRPCRSISRTAAPRGSTISAP